MPPKDLQSVSRRLISIGTIEQRAELFASRYRQADKVFHYCSWTILQHVFIALPVELTANRELT